MTNCGYFDDANREYIITDPKTPVKWINYVGTLAFGGFVDQTGGMLLCKGDPALNRITKYLPQLPGSQFNGATLYLRLPQGDGYQTFSPFFVPTLDPHTLYECHVGLGYTRIVSEFHGIRTDALFLVPPGSSVLVQDTKITNLRDGPAEIDAIPVVEYTHFDALKQFTNADWVPQTMQSRVSENGSGLKVLTQCAFMRRGIAVNYLTSNLPVSSFESDRFRFLGDRGNGTWAAPASLQEAELGNSEAQRGDNIGALLHHLGELQPGETRRLIIQVGQAPSLEDAKAEIQKFRDWVRVEQAATELAAFWDSYLAKLQVKTPDPNMNRMLNIHNPRQCYTTKTWSRYLSLYQLGFGARGIGFRDTSQDIISVVAQVPQEAKALIEKLLQVQRRDGSAFHQFNPLTMVANAGDSREVEDGPRYYGDDHLWVILAISAYLKETGDVAFLDQVIAYYDRDKDDVPIEAGTVMDHMQRAIDFTRNNTGAHGLPLLGFADWNDTVNLAAGAESLFIANLYGKALAEMGELARYLGDDDLVGRFQAYYEEMKELYNRVAWDGEWYVRYLDADGLPLGSKINSEGQIFANGQSWPVISGFAPPERARSALAAVYDRLNTANGIKLSTPGYNGYDPAKGGITTYPPGAKENGGIFLHANPWVIMAETIAGNGPRAFEYYAQINPATKNDKIDEFECEPYVYPQNILGDEHLQFGLARNSWLTGTASWVYQASTQYILGLSATYDGLCINPCIPPEWDGFAATREFRGTVYKIEVQNPDHLSKGIRSVFVDGRQVDTNCLPILEPGQVCQVTIVLGG